MLPQYRGCHVLPCMSRNMGQINPAKFQSLKCMYYIHVIMIIKRFWFDLTWHITLIRMYQQKTDNIHFVLLYYESHIHDNVFIQLNMTLHIYRPRQQFQWTWFGVNLPSGCWVMVSAKFCPDEWTDRQMNEWMNGQRQFHSPLLTFGKGGGQKLDTQRPFWRCVKMTWI